MRPGELGSSRSDALVEAIVVARSQGLIQHPRDVGWVRTLTVGSHSQL